MSDSAPTGEESQMAPRTDPVDVVERLEAPVHIEVLTPETGTLVRAELARLLANRTDAAAEIRRLRAENDRLREKYRIVCVEPTPEALRAWAEWFDDPGRSATMAVEVAPQRKATPGRLLRLIAGEMERP